MAGTSNLTWPEQLLILVFFPKLPQYPFDSEPNTVDCSKFKFPFSCQEDTETAMILM